jgi:amino acid transporter
MAAEGGLGASAAMSPDIAAPGTIGLRHGTLNQIESLGQSISNIAPTLTPAINISVVAAMAGTGTWLAFLIATLGLMFVAGSIASLARRHPLSGSYFVYIGRTIGPVAGALGGWAMLDAYLLTAVAALVSVTIFIENTLSAFGLAAILPPRWVLLLVAGALVWAAAYRDIRLSARLGLALEGASVVLIVVIMGFVLVRHGGVIDPVQLDFSHMNFGGVTQSLALAAFAFVGFESAATLAKETRDPQRLIPRAIFGSLGSVGLFLTVSCYCMVLGMGDDAAAIGASSSPLTDLTTRTGIGWTAGFVYLSATVSGFACALASVTAASRMLFSMARYKVMGRGMDAVHATHQTPHVAVGICCVIVLALCIATLPMSALDAYGTTATLATFGFLVVYLLIAISAPLDLRSVGLVRPIHIVVGAVGALLMAGVILGTLYPVPAWPYNVVPYVFAGYMLIGAAWFGSLAVRRPAVLRMIEHDLEA